MGDRRNFSKRGQRQHFAAPCQVADDAMRMYVHETFYHFYTTTPQKYSCYDNIFTKLRFLGSHSKVYHDNFHNRLSADFQGVVLLFTEVLPWSLANHKVRLYFTYQDLSTSFRNNSCKRLGSRPKQSITLSIKPSLSLLIFSRGTLIIHKPLQVDYVLTGILDNLLKLESQAGFKKIEQWIMTSRHSNGSFELSSYSKVRNNS